ncbi:EcsC protein family protein [Amycolatopsis pretoriensis]|uniref:EcsC protein family protein n=1 Tax=Amycolatopsis pretoriensis TaxID=218821 RepID=A0A1H5RD76_9PSEU|nr:EcsC family protein [Amycolatopsis pretoriensis]SEF36315.1 EcsC protein family protein [Amycolatopsis pretoriensis]
MGIEQMSPYERTAWQDIERWRDERLTVNERRLVPERVRNRLVEGGQVAKGRLEQVPGAEQLTTIVHNSIDGLLTLVNKASEATLRRKAVVAAYAKRGHAVSELSDIHQLDLGDIDKAKPRLGLSYPAFSALEGAAAGLAVSGGELLTTAGGIVGAGAGAAPGAGTVAAAIAADAVLVLGAMTRAIAHTAAYYGYDTELPQERVFALGVLSFGMAQQTSKSVAYLQLNKLVNDLARKATWDQLNKNGVTQIVKAFYERSAVQLTKKKLGQAVPVVGIVIGAGLNARLLSKLTSDAEHLYRERFLREKYDLETVDVQGGDIDQDDDTVHIAEIVEEATTDEPTEG